MRCWKCGTEVQAESGPLKILRNDSCAICHNDLHVCKNCRFYDPQYHNECRETQAEWVSDKERANFCEYFEPGSRGGQTSRSGQDARSAFDKLFGD
ncbi:MAG: hypothetical protein AB1898_03510 [Acidobacteriota bacterium]